MKKIILVSSLVFLGFLNSCKNEENKSNESILEKEIETKKDSLFTIVLNATILKDDSFQIYYKSNNEEVFDEKNSLFTEFKGSDKPQDIVFKLPFGVIPDYIRMDFGTNKNQSEIKVNSFKMSYYDKYFQTQESGFFNYMLVEPKTANFNINQATIQPLLINGVYDPQATSEKALYDQIQLIVK
jgi:hypothetical protein